MKAFLRTWALGYVSPAAFAGTLAGRAGPGWGLAGAGLRAGLDALLLYLPLAWMGRAPSYPSAITFLPTERYFAFLVGLAPLVLLAQWLLLAALTHLLLRLLGRRSDLDVLLNLNGLITLVVGAPLVVWDWPWVLAGSHAYVALGVSHWVISLWGNVLSIVGLRQLLGVPLWLGLGLNVVGFFAAMPLAMVFMRAPL
jgi:hypothetical protein